MLHSNLLGWKTFAVIVQIGYLQEDYFAVAWLLNHIVN